MTDKEMDKLVKGTLLKEYIWWTILGGGNRSLI